MFQATVGVVICYTARMTTTFQSPVHVCLRRQSSDGCQPPAFKMLPSLPLSQRHCPNSFSVDSGQKSKDGYKTTGITIMSKAMPRNLDLILKEWKKKKKSSVSSDTGAPLLNKGWLWWWWWWWWWRRWWWWWWWWWYWGLRLPAYSTICEWTAWFTRGPLERQKTAHTRWVTAKHLLRSVVCLFLILF